MKRTKEKKNKMGETPSGKRKKDGGLSLLCLAFYIIESHATEKKERKRCLSDQRTHRKADRLFDDL